MALADYYDEYGDLVIPEDEETYPTAPTYPMPTSEPAPTPTATAPAPYTGGVTIIGWAPNGSDWIPVYRGSDGQYYTGTSDNMQPWSGDPSILQNGGGVAGKPEWPADQPKPTAPEPPPPTGGGGTSPPGPGNAPPDLSGPHSPPGPGNLPPGGGIDPGPAPKFFFPEFDAPDYTPIDPFSAPSLADAQNEPGYAFAMDQGRKALENSAAARGILRTGGTLKDLFSWGNQFGEQNYANVYNRAANTWGMRNKQHLDTYDTQYRGAKDEFGGRFDAAKLTFEDLYRRWRDILDANTRIATGPGSQ